MKQKLGNTLTALLFLVALVAGVCYLSAGAHQLWWEMEGAGFAAPRAIASALRFHHKAPPVRAGQAVPLTSEEVTQLAHDATAKVEDDVISVLDRDHLFIESYGWLQKAQGRRVMEDIDPQYTVVRLSDGSLTFANPDTAYMAQEPHALAVAEFRDVLAETLDIPLLYVQAPQKVYVNADATLPNGLEDYGDAHANMLARTLRQEEVPYLDLRPVLLDTHRYDELFFSTDHHWTAEGAFLGWQAVADTLEEDFDLELDERSYDEKQYTKTVYEDIFLGSQGKRVGTAYAGTDDLTAWVPTRFTWMEYEVPTQSYDRKGRFQNTLLFRERLEEGDLYDTNPYTYYSGGDYSFARMKNLQNPEGPKVVLLRDSFACPFAPFMALGCGEVITIDLRYFRGDLMNYIKWVEADMVVMLYSPGSLRLESMFDFFSLPGGNRPADRKPLEHVLTVEKPALKLTPPLPDLPTDGEEAGLE